VAQRNDAVWRLPGVPSGERLGLRPLGDLYRPQYFNGGIAVHGLASVPAYPASHGCARVSLPGMSNLWAAGGMTVGTRVLVY